jgi:hypothetical protein
VRSEMLLALFLMEAVHFFPLQLGRNARKPVTFSEGIASKDLPVYKWKIVSLFPPNLRLPTPHRKHGPWLIFWRNAPRVCPVFPPAIRPILSRSYPRPVHRLTCSGG